MIRRRGRGLFAVAGAALLAACASGGGEPPAGIGAPGEPLAGLDAYVADAVQDWDLAGLSIAVVKDGEVVFAEGYGVREVGEPGVVDENTLFAIGSNTKLFTAVAAGMMVDEGRMSWQDPVARHLPGFQLYDPWVTRELTIRDALSHRSGLGRRGDLLWYGSEYGRDEVLRRIRFLEPNSSFRSAYGYQNVMFLAAGEATARAAGESWDRLIDRRIFTPLGMSRSNTSTTQFGDDPNVATPHGRIGGETVPIPWRNIDNIAPAGSINSSALEMAEWMKMLLADGVVGGDTLVRPGTLREIASSHTLIPLEPDTLFPSVHFRSYGLGIVAQDYKARKVLWHTGGIDGMLSLVGLIPEEDLGVVVLTNTAGANNLYTALMFTVFDAYLGGPTRDWSQIMLRQAEEAAQRMAEAEAKALEARVPGTRPSLALDRYAGTYRHELYGDATVSYENGGLVLRRGPAFTGDLEHWHYDTFRATWRGPEGGNALATFALDVSGEPSTLTVGGFGEFERVPEPDTATRP